MSLATEPINLKGQAALARPEPLNGKAKKGENQEENLSLNERLKSVHHFLNENKVKINTTVNAASSITNFLIFLNRNFNFFNLDEEKQEKVGNFFARLATGTRGLMGAIDCLKKNNLIPFIGSALEVPIAALTNGFRLWLSRGIPQSIRQIQGLLKRRDIKIPRSDGKNLILRTDDFAKHGLSITQGLKHSTKELWNITKELFTKPFDKTDKVKLFSHSLITCSVGQFLGPLIALTGFVKTGSFLRDLSGAAVDVAYMLDPKGKGKNSYFIPGTFWIGSAIADYIKLIPFVSDKIQGLNQFSLGCDSLAGIFESLANYDDDDKSTIQEPVIQQAA